MADPKIANRTLLDITIPGTHDSGSYYLTDNLVGEPEWIESIVKVADYLHLPVGKIVDGWSKS